MFPFVPTHRCLQRNTEQNFQFPFLNMLAQCKRTHVNTETMKAFINNRVVLVICSMSHVIKNLPAGKCSVSTICSVKQWLWWSFRKKTLYLVLTGDIPGDTTFKNYAEQMKMTKDARTRTHTHTWGLHLAHKDLTNEWFNRWFLTKMILFCRKSFECKMYLQFITEFITWLSLQHCCSTHLVLLEQLQSTSPCKCSNKS